MRFRAVLLKPCMATRDPEVGHRLTLVCRRNVIMLFLQNFRFVINTEQFYCIILFLNR